MGRYANGDCPVYALGDDKLKAYLSAREESIENYVEAARGLSVACGGLVDVFFVEEIPESDPRTTYDITFRVKTLTKDTCVLERDRSVQPAKAKAPSPTPLSEGPPRSRCSCSSSGPAGAVTPLGLAVAGLAVLRRRRTRGDG
ncbi:MAG TPA: MYXO-CTERM sorting domain-containing protein [Labilithrix sp.]|nr:MYXO-CTERM sorting domain-containing protein [Labilithrix sp.]